MQSADRSACIVYILCVAAIVFCCVSGALADGAETASSKTQLNPLKNIRAELKLNERDKSILGNITDGSESVEDIGFYMLMGKIAKFPQLSVGQSKDFDIPAYGNLLRQPGRYRLEPVRLTVRIVQIEKLTVGDGKISSNPYWSSDKPIWAIFGPPADSEAPETQPMIVYCTTRPSDLPQPKKILPNGREEFSGKILYTINGVFYKYIETMAADGKGTRKYPVLLAWQSRPAESKIFDVKNSVWANQVLAGVVLLATVLALAVFVYIRKKTKPARQRLAEPNQKFSGQTHSANDDEDFVEVDPELAAAAEQYRQEHQQET